MERRFQFQPLPRGRIHDLIVRLDYVDPGLLGWLVRLPERRRQVAYAVLAKVGADFLRPSQSQQTTCPSLEQLMALRPALRDMRQLRPRVLIESYYGACPGGFLGALAKTREGPQGGCYYDRLFAVFTDPSQKRMAKVIRLLPSMDVARLNILSTVDPIFLWPNFCMKIVSAQQAEDLSTTLTLIRRVVGDRASDEAVTASIRSLGETSSVARWVESWLCRAGQIPYPPLDLDSDWVALDSGEKMTEAGLRLQNCLNSADRIIDALKGQVFYYENQRRALIAEVRAVGPQRFLLLTGVHTKRNATVTRRMRRKTQEAFLAAAVPSLDWAPEDCPWRAVERIPNSFFDMQEDDDALEGLEVIDGLSEIEMEVT